MPRLVPALTSYRSASPVRRRPFWPDPGGNRGPHPKYGPVPVATTARGGSGGVGFRWFPGMAPWGYAQSQSDWIMEPDDDWISEGDQKPMGEYTLSSGGLLLAAAAIGAYFLLRKKGA